VQPDVYAATDVTVCQLLTNSDNCNFASAAELAINAALSLNVYSVDQLSNGMDRIGVLLVASYCYNAVAFKSCST